MQCRTSCRNALMAVLYVAGMTSLHAQPLMSDVQLIANPGAAVQMEPPPQTFTIIQAGSYTVTLTDLRSPVALATLQLAVADAADSLLQLTAAGTTVTQTLTLQPGTYTEQVLASAASGSLGGTFSVQVTASDGSAVPVLPQGGSVAAPAFVGTVSPPSNPVAGQSVFQTDFTVNDPGAYQLVIADDAFPAALAGNSLDIALWNDAAPAVLLLTQVNSNAGSFALGSLAAGTYHLIVIAQAAPPALAGLYGITVTGGSGGTSNALASSVPVGNLTVATQIPIQSSEPLTLILTDLAVPSALSTLQSIVVEGASVLQPTVGAGMYTVGGVAAGQVSLYVMAQAGAQGEGAFAAVMRSGSQTLLDLAQPVTDGTHPAYGFTATLSAAGNYQLYINDFAIPAALLSLRVAVEQGATLAATATATGGSSATVSQQLQAGPVNWIAFASPSANAGLFGVKLTSSAGATLYQSTQGVGSAFHAQSVTVQTSGSYTLSLADLGFPASFAQLDLIATSGAQIVGQVDGSGSLSLSATPGSYTLNVLAQTGTTQSGAAAGYGLYGLQMTGPVTQTGSPPNTANSGGGGGAVSVPDLSALLLALLWQWRRRHLRRTAHS